MSIVSKLINFYLQANMILVGGWTTHLKNMLVKLDHFPKVRGENKTYLKPPPRIGSPRFFSTSTSGKLCKKSALFSKVPVSILKDHIILSFFTNAHHSFSFHLELQNHNYFWSMPSVLVFLGVLRETRRLRRFTEKQGVLVKSRRGHNPLMFPTPNRHQPGQKHPSWR